MTHRQAEALVLALRAAFERPVWPDATKRLYETKLGELSDFDAAKDAVNAVIETARFRPSIAEILVEYEPLAKRRREERAASHGLPLPEMTEADRQANLRRARELRDRLAEHVSRPG